MPQSVQQRLRIAKATWSVKKGSFASPEPEYSNLGEWIQPGDWVIDVGANIGHYTLAFSQRVGQDGRVIAFEPVPETFMVLCQCMNRSSFKNITLLNVAASSSFDEVLMTLPEDDSGMTNYYQASIGESGPTSGVRRAVGVPIDALGINKTIRLIKIDAEGHDSAVLRGAWELVCRDLPTIIVESLDQASIDNLVGLGYEEHRLSGSPNAVYRHRCE